MLWVNMIMVRQLYVCTSEEVDVDISVVCAWTLTIEISAVLTRALTLVCSYFLHVLLLNDYAPLSSMTMSSCVMRDEGILHHDSYIMG